MAAKEKGLYANIHAKQARVAAGDIDPDTGKPEKMRKKGQVGAPSSADFKDSAKTVKKAEGGHINQHKRMAMGEDVL
tara:strand:- start:1116 stop:1346 length:231 start_codon:yes stop_codon:yes gene_type:complete